MRPPKAKPGDERLIHDETADWVDRSSALSRLAADGRLDLESVAEQWLEDPDPRLASEGLNLLLSYWPQNPLVDAYVEVAILSLAAGQDSDMRRDAASSLGTWLEQAPDYAQRVIPELLAALELDEDESVQQACYKALLGQVAPGQSAVLLAPDEVLFDRSRDVRWDLLEPLRARYGSEPMRRLKARPGDEHLIHDETADWGERSSALSRLAADRRPDLEPVARQWLHDPDPGLASEGLIHLLIYWRDSPRVHEYVEVAIQWLEAAEDSDMRWAAASSLGTFLERTSRYAQEIVPALLTALEQDEDESVQEACYMALLRQVAPGESGVLVDPDKIFFDCAADVRWELLTPLRERYGKH